MPSNSLVNWNSDRSDALDEIRDAHQTVGGTGRGRRYTTMQINHAYTMLLSSQFQGFCRDLHSESVDHIVRVIHPKELRGIVRAEFTLHRKLDRGNPNPGNIGADFNRLGLLFWDHVRAQSRWNIGRTNHLTNLNDWRNAIAHQDFDPAKLGGTIKLRLATVNQWRKACNQLANVFDGIMQNHIHQISGTHPW